jgi:hypothetical protein
MANLGPAGDLLVRNEGAGRPENAAHHAIFVRDELYAKMSDQPVRLQIDYSLTLLRLADAHAIQAIGGKQAIAGVGRCETKLNPAGTAVQLACLQAGKPASCTTSFLEHVPSGTRNLEIVHCAPDYIPFFAQFEPDAMRRLVQGLPFRDPAGVGRFPVSGPQLHESRVVVRIYEAEDHFTRRLVIPGARLRDWLPE